MYRMISNQWQSDHRHSKTLMLSWLRRPSIITDCLSRFMFITQRNVFQLRDRARGSGIIVKALRPLLSPIFLFKLATFHYTKTSLNITTAIGGGGSLPLFSPSRGKVIECIDA